FDLARADYVQILVPVPDHLYDPRLLFQDSIAPDFQVAITQAALRETQAQAAFDELETAQAWALGLVDIAKVAPQIRATPSPASEADDYIQDCQAILAEISDKGSSVPLAAEEQSLIDPAFFPADMASLNQGDLVLESSFAGLKPLAELLESRVNKANDLMDMSFLRLQSDIYRVRKQLVGESDATRLATSPVLANLASSATSLELGKIFNIGNYDAPVAGFTLSRDYQIGAQASGDVVAVANMAEASESLVSVSYADNYTNMDFGNDLLFGQVGTIATRDLEAINAEVMTVAAPVKISSGVSVDLSNYGISSIRADMEKTLVSSSDVALQGLLYGKAAPIRTATIAERLRPSPAQEAKNAAVATKAQVISALQDLGLNLTGLQLPVSASRVTLVPELTLIAEITRLSDAGQDEAVSALTDRGLIPVFDGVAVLLDARIVKAAPSAAQAVLRASLQTLYNSRLDLAYAGLSSLVLSDRLDPDPADGDEGAYFAAAVDALESAVSLLRLAEGRVQAYTAF
ncbi:MAG: hypothetical protein ACPGVJ_08085, partial [Mangrovicoccus sp.]